MTGRVVDFKVLPGQPLDGSGRVCIHLFVRDERGPFTEPCVMHATTDENGEEIKGKVDIRPARGRLACDSKRRVEPSVVRTKKMEAVAITLRSDDPRAVTCIKCKATHDYTDIMDRIERAYQGTNTQDDEET